MTITSKSFGTAAHFAIEPLQIMWHEKKVLLALLATPLIMSLILPYVLPSTTALGMPLSMAQIIGLILQPFWAIAWIQYIFHPKEKPTVKSYFAFHKFYVYFFGCSLLMQILSLTIGHIEDLNIFNQASLLALWLLWTILILPINIAFPAIALHTPFALWKSWSIAKPFYANYLVAIGLAILMLSLASIIFLFIAKSILAVFYITAPTAFQFLSLWWPETLISQLGSLLAETYSFTLPALYYKQYLWKK